MRGGMRYPGKIKEAVQHIPSLNLTRNLAMPSSRSVSYIPQRISVSAAEEDVPTESRSNWVNSRYRPASGLSALQTGPTW